MDEDFEEEVEEDFDKEEDEFLDDLELDWGLILFSSFFYFIQLKLKYYNSSISNVYSF